MAKDIIAEGNIKERNIVIREDKQPPSEHERLFDTPTAVEVAILLDNEPTEIRDFIGANASMMDTSSEYPCYTQDTIRCNTRCSSQRNGCKVTQQQYYNFHMKVRDGNYLLQGACRF